MGSNGSSSGGGEGPANRYQKPPKKKLSIVSPTIALVKSVGEKLEDAAVERKLFKQRGTKEGDELEGIRISSYYSIGPKGAAKDPIYVSIDTKESREFGQAMSRGDYGPLD